LIEKEESENSTYSSGSSNSPVKATLVMAWKSRRKPHIHYSWSQQRIRS